MGLFNTNTPQLHTEQRLQTQEENGGFKTSEKPWKKSRLSFTHQQITYGEHIIAIISIFLIL